MVYKQVQLEKNKSQAGADRVYGGRSMRQLVSKYVLSDDGLPSHVAWMI